MEIKRHHYQASVVLEIYPPRSKRVDIQELDAFQILHPVKVMRVIHAS